MSVPRDLRRSGGAKSPENETRGVVWEVSSRKGRAFSPRLPFQVESSPERAVQAARRAVGVWSGSIRAAEREKKKASVVELRSALDRLKQASEARELARAERKACPASSCSLGAKPSTRQMPLTPNYVRHPCRRRLIQTPEGPQPPMTTRVHW